MQITLKTILAGSAVVIIIFFLLGITQNNPSNLMLLPILFITIVISWYLHREIRREHEENLKHGIRYAKDELEAQQWLEKSFIPKVRLVTKRHMLAILAASGTIFLSFLFVWSFFVGGLITALLNTGIGLALFAGCIVYILLTPKELDRLFRHVPASYRHHKSNEWVHAYLVLLPFATICYLLYSLTTAYQGMLQLLFCLPGFLFFYTLSFICLYCFLYLYHEYRKEQLEEIKKVAKKMIEES